MAFYANADNMPQKIFDLMFLIPVWTLTKNINIDLISILQKKCLRIINFASFNSHTNDVC